MHAARNKEGPRAPGAFLAEVVVAAPATAVAGATTTTFLGQALTGLRGLEVAELT
jgi:hypothetical protein